MDGLRYGDTLLGELEIHNKRPVLAHVDASASYLMDDQFGAENLSPTDRVLPSEGWLRIESLRLPLSLRGAPLLIMRDNTLPDLTARRQSVRLTIRWEDGVVEPVDLEYQVVRKGPPASG